MQEQRKGSIFAEMNESSMIQEEIREIAGNVGLDQWLVVGLTGLVLLLLALLLHFLIFRTLQRLSLKHDKALAAIVRKRFRLPGLLFLLTIAAYIVLLTFDPEEQLSGSRHLLNLLLILAITWILIRFVSFGKDIILRRYDIDEKDNLRARRVHTQLRVLERIIVFVLILIGLAAALMTFEGIREIGVSLFATAGVAGIILGFAAQRLIGTVLAGFQIAVTQPIRLEDVVIVENEWGWIEEITLTYVVVRIWDRRRLIVPTTYFIEKPFQNWTRVSADILGTVYIYTDYQVPFNQLREELTKILEHDPHWDGNVNVLQVTDATDRSVEIRALMSAADSPTAWDLRVNVREKLIEFLRNNYPGSLPRTRVSFEKDPGASADPAGDHTAGDQRA